MTKPGVGDGPYLDDDGDIWFPVDTWDWNMAQSEAASIHRDSDSKTHYEGKMVAHLCPQSDDWEVCEWDTIHQRLAYHFSPGAEFYG